MVISNYAYDYALVISLVILREVAPGTNLQETADALEAEAAARLEALVLALGLGTFCLSTSVPYPPRPPPSSPPSAPPPPSSP
eukprot:scaffold33284_cov90-Isochrysis_galbana.AAC.1